MTSNIASPTISGPHELSAGSPTVGLEVVDGFAPAQRAARPLNPDEALLVNSKATEAAEETRLANEEYDEGDEAQHLNDPPPAYNYVQPPQATSSRNLTTNAESDKPSPYAVAVNTQDFVSAPGPSSPFPRLGALTTTRLAPEAESNYPSATTEAAQFQVSRPSAGRDFSTPAKPSQSRILSPNVEPRYPTSPGEVSSPDLTPVGEPNNDSFHPEASNTRGITPEAEPNQLPVPVGFQKAGGQNVSLPIDYQPIAGPSTSLPAGFQPIVIPQLSQRVPGQSVLPFARAYAPTLSDIGLPESSFVGFIDGLNDAIAFQSQLGAEQSLAQSNQTLFHPRGLHVDLCGSQAMLKEVNVPPGQLQLPQSMEQTLLATSYSRATSGAPPSEDDPRVRCIRAMKGWAQQITFDVIEQHPQNTSVDTLGGQVSQTSSASNAHEKSKRQVKKEEKAARRCEEELSKADKKRQENSKTVKKITREIEQLQTKAQAEAAKAQAKGNENKVAKTRMELAKDLADLQRDLNRENARLDYNYERQVNKAYRKGTKVDRKADTILTEDLWLVIRPKIDESAEQFKIPRKNVQALDL